MTNKEALQALLKGKYIAILRPYPGCVRFTEGGGLQVKYERGRQEWESFECAWVSGIDYQFYEEPNRNPQGSFAWAYEEVKRERGVIRPGMPGYLYSFDKPISALDALAMDWESRLP